MDVPVGAAEPLPSSSPQQVLGQPLVVGDPDVELLEEIVELPLIDDDVMPSDDVFCWTASFHDCAADDPLSYEPNAWMQAGGGIAAQVAEMMVPGTGLATDQLWTAQPDGIMPSELGAFLWNSCS
jgi:hypothetical protein